MIETPTARKAMRAAIEKGDKRNISPIFSVAKYFSDIAAFSSLNPPCSNCKG